MRPLIYLLLLLLAACATPAQPTAEDTGPVPFLLGTYTNGDSEGIYRYLLYPDGTVVQSQLAAATPNPSYLAYNADRSVVVAVDEDQEGGVVSFRVADGELTRVNRQPTGGAHPCHVSVGADGYVTVANYTGGNLALLRLENGTGRLSGPLDVADHREREGDTPHAHSSYFVGEEVIAADLGTDALWRYRLDTGAGKLIPVTRLDLAAGAGPRHLTFHPGGEWGYAINELNSTVTLLKRAADGTLTVGNSWSTLPPDFGGDNACADLHLSQDGRYLYGSNRGHNSIVVFAVNPKTGALIPIQHEPVVGDWPRNFALSPNGEFLLVANQRSGNITTLRRNARSGKLQFVGETAAPTPVSILF